LHGVLSGRTVVARGWIGKPILRNGVVEFLGGVGFEDEENEEEDEGRILGVPDTDGFLGP